MSSDPQGPPRQGPPPGGNGTPDPAAYMAAESSPEFIELRRRYRGFSFPMTVVFLVWYFAFVLASTYAVDFMSKPVLGNVTIGLIWGLLQFITTFGITALYIRHANKNLDPIATKIRNELEGVR